MPSSRRIERLSDLFREEIGNIILRELELPEETLVTVTRVEISPDGHYTTVFVSLLGADVTGVWLELQKRIGEVQHLLNRRVRIRPVPKIRFEIDEQEFRRERVERSLAKLKKKGDI